MALISTKNLVTPLTNMVNIITVLLLAICFAVLRLSGAGLTVQRVDANNNKTISSRTDVTERIQQENTNTQQSGTMNADIFKPAPRVIIGNSNGTKDNTNKSGTGTSRSLDDIEKSLGIR